MLFWYMNRDLKHILNHNPNPMKAQFILNSASTQIQLNFDSTSLQPQPQINLSFNINLNSTSTLTSTQYGSDIKATQSCFIIMLALDLMHKHQKLLRITPIN